MPVVDDIPVSEEIGTRSRVSKHILDANELVNMIVNEDKYLNILYYLHY